MNKRQVKFLAGLVAVYRISAAVRRGEEVQADWNRYCDQRSTRNLLRFALAEAALLADLGVLVR